MANRDSDSTSSTSQYSNNQSSNYSNRNSAMSDEVPRKRGLGGFHRGRGAKRARQTFVHQKHTLPRDDTETLRLTEKDLGITEYISTFPGFNGVIKQRYVYKS